MPVSVRRSTAPLRITRRNWPSFFAGLGPVVNIAKRVQAELDRTAATKFSVFEYFKQAATNRIREIHLSRVFGDLLDPTGVHGQGAHFLRLLLDEVQLEDFSRLCLQKCKVHLEHPTNTGRKIDIALEIPDNRWIGIENKPWAEEGEEQVKHYLEDLQSKDANAWMLYLSGNGSCPLSLQGCGNTNCLTVPYRSHGDNSLSVENWIRQCWKECEGRTGALVPEGFTGVHSTVFQAIRNTRQRGGL